MNYDNYFKSNLEKAVEAYNNEIEDDSCPNFELGVIVTLLQFARDLHIYDQKLIDKFADYCFEQAGESALIDLTVFSPFSIKH